MGHLPHGIYQWQRSAFKSATVSDAAATQVSTAARRHQDRDTLPHATSMQYRSFKVWSGQLPEAWLLRVSRAVALSTGCRVLVLKKDELTAIVFVGEEANLASASATLGSLRRQIDRLVADSDKETASLRLGAADVALRMLPRGKAQDQELDAFVAMLTEGRTYQRRQQASDKGLRKAGRKLAHHAQVDMVATLK